MSTQRGGVASDQRRCWRRTREAGGERREASGRRTHAGAGPNVADRLPGAPGHVEHTARPGEPGNCVITAHRDMHFAALRQVRAGDLISVQHPDGRWFRYRVDGRRVVDERETWVTPNLLP